MVIVRPVVMVDGGLIVVVGFSILWIITWGSMRPVAWISLII